MSGEKQSVNILLKNNNYNIIYKQDIYVYIYIYIYIYNYKQ